MPPTSRAKLVQLMYLLEELDKFGWRRTFDPGQRKVLKEYLEAVGEWDDIKNGKKDGRRR